MIRSSAYFSYAGPAVWTRPRFSAGKLHLRIHTFQAYSPDVKRSSENLATEFMRICRTKDYRGAGVFQREIRHSIPGKPVKKNIRNICGLDVSFDKRSDRVYAAASIFRYPGLDKIEERASAAVVHFPYVPGLLAFREGPAVMKLLRLIESQVDLLLFDGQGLAHPRGTGIASMMGLLLNMPSVGCAKTRLIGDYEEPEGNKGSQSSLIYKERLVGMVVRTRENVKPVFVSAGYKVDLRKAVEIVLNCTTRYRIPEPIRAAHAAANKLRAAG